MKKQFALVVGFLFSTTFFFAQQVDVTISTSNVDPIIKPGEYTLLKWSVKSRNNMAVPENKIKFFLSKDKQFTKDDIFLGSSLVPELTEGIEGKINYTWVRIPSDTNLGNHTVFFHVDADNEIEEVSETDNVTAEVVKVVANLKSDLIVESTDLPLFATEGNQLKVGWATKNQGKAVSPPTKLTIYLSKVPKITNESIKILDFDSRSVRIGERIIDEAILTIPNDNEVDGGVIGERYLVFETDSNFMEKESNEYNNVDFKRIKIGSACDLVSTDVEALARIDYYAPHAKGVLYDVHFKVKNQGRNTTEKPAMVSCYLSKDTNLDRDDRLIYLNTNVPVLDNGDAFEVNFSNRWVGQAPDGPDGPSLEETLRELLNYHVIVVVDPEDIISESDEDNNITVKDMELSTERIKGFEKKATTVVYPVPVKDVLNIVVTDHTEITIYSVATGSIVLNKTFTQSGKYEVNVASLKRGNYILDDHKGKKINMIKR
ncbi:CARDB domain-containing protein [Aquimarina megaterium]|uniref:CARDB domain-containing protein n=1 Tax=Aquimarina megaterium TaxID=1443666 RepID=UPI00046F9828|nr:CARDB domain-containing protein [Aquimarina megaterium]